MTDEIKLTSSQFDMFHNGVLHNIRGNFINITKKGLIYISKGDYGRWYWLLERIKPKDRPTIKLNDVHNSLTISTFKLVIHSTKHYEFIKKYLDRYTN